MTARRLLVVYVLAWAASVVTVEFLVGRGIRARRLGQDTWTGSSSSDCVARSSHCQLALATLLLWMILRRRHITHYRVQIMHYVPIIH